MDTLDGTEWDILLSGTGMQMSLLALALSRSKKRILHIDRNDYYGGTEAALSLQEAENWVKTVESEPNVFSNASLHHTSPDNSEKDGAKLGFSRAYSLALAPQLLYTESKLLPFLISSKVYRQLDFLAMGSWWVYTPTPLETQSEGETSDNSRTRQAELVRVPTTREDVVFSNREVDLRSKRAVVKLLRFFMDFENQDEVWMPYREKPFPVFLVEHFKLPKSLHNLFLALTVSPDNPRNTTTGYAVPRIARHLRSTGKLGPGFSSVIPKWGGLSEIAQIGCRAAAVGGAVYVLGNGIKGRRHPSTIELDGGEILTTSFTVRSANELGGMESTNPSARSTAYRSISIISSPLTSLFQGASENSPMPAGSVIVFPSGSLDESEDTPPVYLIVHSSDTGECPVGQCVVYAYTSGRQELNTSAVSLLLAHMGDVETMRVLWSMHYQQHCPLISEEVVSEDENFITWSPTSLDLVFDETILDSVKDIWQRVLADGGGDFLVFEDRNLVNDEEDD